MSDTTGGNGEKRYEVRDARFKTIFWSGIALALLVLFALAINFAVFSVLKERREKAMVPPPPLAPARELPPAPRLQVAPEMDLQRFLAQEDSLASTYGWVVKEAGVVRIPVERAMELMLKTGFPVRSDYQEWQGKNEGERP